MDKTEEQSQQKQLEEEFISSLDDFTATIPDELTDFYLKQAGFSSSDPKMTKLISLAAQKFVTDVATDSMTACKLRQQNTAQRRKDKKVVLTIEDLSASLKEYGVNINKPAYYATQPGAVKGGGQEKKKSRTS